MSTSIYRSDLRVILGIVGEHGRDEGANRPKDEGCYADANSSFDAAGYAFVTSAA
jgi:hypothetical protein